MSAGTVRVAPSWLRLREPVDAQARNAELVEKVDHALPARSPVIIYDLGCGTGAMPRWLAPRLSNPQHWVLYDLDADLLRAAAAGAPIEAADGSPVTAATRRRDITRLHGGDLADADLITGSAVLDLLTERELERVVAGCADAHRPTLLTLSVTGHVELTPAEPLDDAISAAFNDHQRRPSRGGRLVGPDAAARAVVLFRRAGASVHVRPSPWRLRRADSTLVASWFTGWLAAAVEQQPELEGVARAYAARRLGDAAAGRLTVTVQHVDLLAIPRSGLR